MVKIRKTRKNETTPLRERIQYGLGEMKYRIYPEPIDVEADSPESAKHKIKYIEGKDLEICKILPIDKDGFVIRL